MVESLDIPGYRLEHRIASGAMGTVYSAIQVSIGARRAVKILHDHLAEDDRFLARFKSEAQTAATVRAENVVSIIEFNGDNDPPFLVMDYIDGPTLATLLKSVRPFPKEIAVLILYQLARGLEAAHACQVVHRDLKPSNVMITETGTVKVADFGLAKSLLDAPQLTEAGQRLGTLAYMSPQQITLSRDVDFRSDLFSFGVIAYQLLTGLRPFRGSDADTIRRAILREDPVPASDRSLLIDEDLSAFVSKLLEKDLHRRPDRVEWAREWLESYVAAHNIFGWRAQLKDFIRAPEVLVGRLRERDARNYVNKAHLLIKLGETRAREAFKELAIALYLCPHDAEALEVKHRVAEMLKRQAISPSEIVPRPMADALEDSGVHLWEEWETPPANGGEPDEEDGSSETVVEAPLVGDAEPAPAATESGDGTARTEKGDSASAGTPPAAASPPAPTPTPERTPPPDPTPVPAPRPGAPEREGKPASRLTRQRVRARGGRTGAALASIAALLLVAVVAWWLTRWGETDAPRAGGGAGGDGGTASLASLLVEDVTPAGAAIQLVGADGTDPIAIQPGVRRDDLSAGSYVLRATAAGCRPFQTTIELDGDERQPPISLVRRHATLTVRSRPAADVTAGDAALGRAPISDAVVHALGQVEVALRAPGHATWDTVLTLTDGQHVTLDAELSPLSTACIVTVRADGLDWANLRVDGERGRRVSLPYEMNLEPRGSSYRVSLERYGWRINPPAIALTARAGQRETCPFDASCAFGFLTVTGGMYNSVIIDGERYWNDRAIQTPLRALRVPCKAGGYEIRIERDGELSAPRRADISPGDTTRVRF